MQDIWNDDQPIYKQLRDKVAGLIIDGAFSEGEAIPSVRQVSAEYQINHLTVSKAYQELVDEGVLIMKRGRGMFVVDGAKGKLLSQERVKFISDELPMLIARIKSLGISTEELVALMNKGEN